MRATSTKTKLLTALLVLCMMLTLVPTAAASLPVICDLMLWVALFLAGGSVLTGMTVLSKKKKFL